MRIKPQHIGAWFGLIAALGLVVFSELLYLGGLKATMGTIAYIGYVIPIGLATAAALAQRRAYGGYLGFRAALSTTFLVLVMAAVAQTLFAYVLYNFVDPHFGSVLAAETANRTEASLRAQGMPAADLKNFMDDLRSRPAYSAGGMTQGLAISCIVYFLVALLIAAVVRKKKV